MVQFRDGPSFKCRNFQKEFLQERIAYLVYEFGSHFYSFHGLREYKSKYATNWVSRYTLYSRDSWIAYVMIALLIIDNAPVEQTQGRISGLKNGYEESIKNCIPIDEHSHDE